MRHWAQFYVRRGTAFVEPCGDRQIIQTADYPAEETEMSENADQKIQILRTIDKFDHLGRDGVVELLQKPFSEFGADLDPVRANLIGDFLSSGKAATTNEEVIDAMCDQMHRVAKVGNRLRLMTALDADITKDTAGNTAWDRLLALPENADETWGNGSRPANIAWALDDIIKLMTIPK